MGQSEPITSQEVAQRIREDIVQEIYQPLQRLIELEISANLETTRPVVHEALKQLETEGLVQLIPRKGFIVLKITLEKATEIYEAREAAEGLVCQLFVTRATGSQIEQLENAINDFELLSKNLQSKNILLAAKNQVYEVLFDGCGNSIITSFLRSLRHRISWLRARTLTYEGRADYTVRELRAILAAIKSGDKEMARQASVFHVREAAKVAYAELRRRDET